MGTEFCNQCCQSPSVLTFSFISESYHRVLPFWDAICQAVSFDLFPASTFVPSFTSSFVLQATSQILILPAVFKIHFEHGCTQWSTVAIIASNNSYYQTLGNITVIWRRSVRRPRLGRHWPQTLFSSLQVTFQSSGWWRSLNHWWLWVFSVDKRNQLVWQLT